MAQIPLRPLIQFPLVAQARRKYLLKVDLCHSLPFDQWPYDKEEYPLTCLVESAPLFEHRAQGTATLVLHRFGGTYGAVQFVLKATDRVGTGCLRLIFVGESGLPIQMAELPGVQVVPNAELEAAALADKVKAAFERTTLPGATLQAFGTANTATHYSETLEVRFSELKPQGLVENLVTAHDMRHQLVLPRLPDEATLDGHPAKSIQPAWPRRRSRS